LFGTGSENLRQRFRWCKRPRLHHKQSSKLHSIPKLTIEPDAFAVIIKEGNYLEEYDGRYKVKDIKETLENIYHKKCAFCEKKLLDTSRAIEHFRPKKANNRIKKCDASFGYYWLAFAWDNLLLACG
jgi:hypothetical protein